jgi:sugar phosphate isomerase/epimerase
MNRLSLAPVTLNEVEPPALIAAAAAAGFDAAGLRVLGAPGAAPVAPLVGNRKLVAAIAAACADTGVAIFAATGVWLVPDFDLDSVRPALEVAARLGAEWFVTVGNDPDEARMTDNLGRLAVAAASFQLRLSVELMPYTALNSLEKADRMVAASGSANVGLLIDALHLARSGGTPEAVARLRPERIAYLQLCDAPRAPPADMPLRVESLTSRLYPGDGELPLLALIDALPADIVIDVETPVAADRLLAPEQRAARAAAATRRLVAAGKGLKSSSTC